MHRAISSTNMTVILLLSELQPTVVQLLLKYCIYYASAADSLITVWTLTYRLDTLYSTERITLIWEMVRLHRWLLYTVRCQYLKLLWPAYRWVGWLSWYICCLDIKYVTVTRRGIIEPTFCEAVKPLQFMVYQVHMYLWTNAIYTKQNKASIHFVA